ncbi:MAG: VacJ family lipoprotein [Rubrivivax sp.]|nr:VacJ family lipoprotein [Rubrivivax sp.]
MQPVEHWNEFTALDVVDPVVGRRYGLRHGAWWRRDAVTPTGDPWEGFNRKAFSFNEKVDAAVLRPVALG